MTPETVFKPLKANLLRLGFKEYSNTEDCYYIFVENNHDQVVNTLSMNRGTFDKDIRVDALFSIFHSSWRTCYVQKDTNLIASFNKIIKDFIIGFINWLKEEKDFGAMIGNLENIEFIDVSTIEEIEEAIKNKFATPNNMSSNSIVPQQQQEFDYAVITALEEEEMEKILPMFTKEGELNNTRNYIEYGHLKSNPQKKIVYASQHNSGMVDAAILTTEILTRCKPKYLIMVGVLGGKPNDTNIGDVVIATKVFTIDSGKITDYGFKKEANVAQTESKEIKKISREKNAIQEFINRSDDTRKTNISIHFGPIACVNQVIDKKGFFEDNISEIERKAIALEMESYAVVRACHLVNEGKTIPLIIKSVMDNTQNKTDNAKTYAAWTSAKFLEYILNNDLI
jgi:nucleoside phosphorylase